MIELRITRHAEARARERLCCHDVSEILNRLWKQSRPLDPADKVEFFWLVEMPGRVYRVAWYQSVKYVLVADLSNGVMVTIFSVQSLAGLG